MARAEKPLYSSTIAQAFGYTEEELSSIPQEANLGLSCGNPLAIASLREGETVVDLGSGAGFDVFLAAEKVGLKGRAIGIDMNEDMLARANKNHTNAGKPSNVSFIEGKITQIPLQDGIADCVISNCVINLVPEAEKPTVFAEIARILKPGGRVAISDILARKPFPKQLRTSCAAYVGCIAGCSLKEQYEQYLTASGFGDIAIIDTHSDLNIYKDAAKEGMPEDTQVASCCGAPGKCGPTAPKNLHANGSNGGAATGTAKPPESSETWDMDDIDINEWAGKSRSCRSSYFGH
ncbi:MAG: hypothetical protein M1820_006114 [Bogoriella megaspora]|nr:MAG: hypothetical protein M1820_006114 [Bogoriella megaspora]